MRMRSGTAGSLDAAPPSFRAREESRQHAPTSEPAAVGQERRRREARHGYTRPSWPLQGGAANGQRRVRHGLPRRGPAVGK